MSTAHEPGFEVTVTACRQDGAAVQRIRLCWLHPPSASDVLRTLTRLAGDCGRAGHRLRVDDAQSDLAVLLELCGMSRPAGPIRIEESARRREPTV